MIVTKHQHPRTPPHAASWERGKSPWHKDGFPAELAWAAPEQGEKPSEGWFLIDAWGNQIGFVPDGTEIVDEPTGGRE